MLSLSSSLKYAFFFRQWKKGKFLTERIFGRVLGACFWQILSLNFPNHHHLIVYNPSIYVEVMCHYSSRETSHVLWIITENILCVKCKLSYVATDWSVSPLYVWKMLHDVNHWFNLIYVWIYVKYCEYRIITIL